MNEEHKTEITKYSKCSGPIISENEISVRHFKVGHLFTGLELSEKVSKVMFSASKNLLKMQRIQSFLKMRLVSDISLTPVDMTWAKANW